MALPEGAKWKEDGDGVRVFVGDDPVMIDADGVEKVVDFAGMSSKLHDVNGESARRKQKIRDLESSAEAFKDIDPAKYADYKTAAERLEKLEKGGTGKPDELAARLDTLTGELATLKAERDAANTKAEKATARSQRMAIGRAFDSDPHFVKQNGSAPLTTLPPAVAQTQMGRFCAPDDSGQIRVYYDAEHKDVVRSDDGQPAPFGEAIAKLGAKQSWWKDVQTPKGGSGSGMEAGRGGISGRTIKTKADLSDFADKKAYIEANGHDAYRELPAK